MGRSVPTKHLFRCSHYNQGLPFLPPSSPKVKIFVKKPTPRIVERHKPKQDIVHEVVDEETNVSCSADPMFLECHELRKVLEDGPCGFRTITAIGALFSYIAACVDFVEEEEHYYGVQLVFLIATIYILVFTFFIMTLGR